MTKSGGRQIPAILSSKSLTRSPDSDLPDRRNDRKPQRRRTRNPPGIRLKKDSGFSAGKRTSPATPFLRWKFDDGDVSVAGGKTASESGKKSRRKEKNAGEVFVSARKLAAALWHLQLPEGSTGGDSGRVVSKRADDRLGLEPVLGHLGVSDICNPNIAEYDQAVKEPSPGPLSVPHPKNGILYKLEPSAKFHNSAMERATKWDPGCSKTSDDVYRFYGHLKFLEDQQITTVSVISTLQTELEQSRTRIHELETERRSSKKKLDHFLRKLAEERATWRSREHEKIRAIIDDVKDDLNRERKNRQRMEIVNSKLVTELNEAKLSAKRFLQDYEKERKARELMEEVCDELAKEIGDDKAEVEALKRESMKIREEVEEERKMLQMAEVWREERVQMKLIDAKLMLEEKHSQLSKLIMDLEAFLKSRSTTADSVELREAELLRDAASLVKVQDIKEFSYQPPTSEDIFSVFEELQSGEANERDIEPCYGYSPASHASKIHTVSPEIDGPIENPMQRYTNMHADGNGDVEEDGSGWETVTHDEEQGSSNSPEGSDPSVNGLREESNMSESGTEWEENADNDMLNTEISEVYAASVTQSRKKASSISRLWRSYPNNGDNCKTVSANMTNGRLSNGRISNGTATPDGGSAGGLSPPSLGQWSSPDSGNPHITRGMKGCIEWPRGIQKNSLKAKLLEARLESQKIQLRQVLKQKI
ncbi:uncharacterized protein LOC131240159 [Magnolia sinica]|uniref:uncharacterized protein LOC131240159 n=1 Tax=Magnolia sinica TaxID=86752 RepID=UPI00265A25DD|nr:uncharacterized protein LOC131240159 [Magnolia sinica]